LDTLNQELEEERTKTVTVIGKQSEELEEVKKKTEEGAVQQKKMKARMTELQNELE